MTVTARWGLRIASQVDEVIAEARIKYPDRSSDTLDLIARARLQTSMSAFDVLTPPNPDYVQLVSAIDVPSLLVIGDTASVVLPAVASELQRLNPRFQTEQIREAGHGVPYDRPERFAAVVKSFLRLLAPYVQGL